MGVIPIRQHTKKLLSALLAAAGILLLFVTALEICSDEISFSRPSGFYDDTFELEISCGLLYDVYYTLDGSQPTADSIPYQPGVPITISDVSSGPDRYASLGDISKGYDQQFLDAHGYSHWDYEASTQNTEKCTVIRAAAFRNGEPVGDSVSSVYFVGYQHRPDYQDIYIVSLTAEPKDLFGYENGIMVTGQVMDNYIERMTADQKLDSRWWWWEANYHNTGPEWERTAHITVFSPEREMEMNQTCGIRIHGGASRAFPLKSIRCYARSEYAGLDFFETDWFGKDIQPSKFTLYSGGNDAGGGYVCVNIKDYMMNCFAQDLGFSAMDFIPCALFINGEFWGLYHIAEHYNAKYLADHYGVHENNVLLIKNSAVEEGLLSDMELYDNMKSFISNTDMRIEANYRAACDLIDIDSCINYYAFMIYIARTGDWPNGNYALWRTIEQESSPYGDGKWRWMMFDLNSAGMATAEKNLLEDDTLQMVLNMDPLFASLFQNPQFQKEFSERILYIGNTILAPETCSSFIDSFFTEYDGLLQRSNMHVFNDPKETLLETYCGNLKTFFSQRCDVIRSLLEKHLDPAVASTLE